MANNPVDKYVGERLRVRRMLLGLSQEQLGEAVGITFQQIQKYERGANRIGASRMFDIANALQVPVAYFYDEMPEHVSQRSPAHLQEPHGAMVDVQVESKPVLAKREALELVRSFYRIKDSKTRKQIVSMIRAIADSHEKSE